MLGVPSSESASTACEMDLGLPGVSPGNLPRKLMGVMRRAPRPWWPGPRLASLVRRNAASVVDSSAGEMLAPRGVGSNDR